MIICISLLYILFLNDDNLNKALINIFFLKWKLLYLIILKQKCLIPFLLRIVQCMLSINHIKRSMSINNTLVQVMYRYLMHVSLYGCIYLFDHTTKTYLMAALTRFQFSEGIYFFVIYYIMKNAKVCVHYMEKNYG